jgi:hypothetical protein
MTYDTADPSQLEALDDGQAIQGAIDAANLTEFNFDPSGGHANAAGAGAATLVASNGPDLLAGGAAADSIAGGVGANAIDASAGDNPVRHADTESGAGDHGAHHIAATISGTYDFSASVISNLETVADGSDSTGASQGEGLDTTHLTPDWPSLDSQGAANEPTHSESVSTAVFCEGGTLDPQVLPVMGDQHRWDARSRGSSTI